MRTQTHILKRFSQSVSIQYPLYLLFFIGLIFLFLRAKYGFCFNDEAFCVTLAQRLFNGDALIAQEWHGCQFFSAIMLPLYSLYRLFSSNNEGILLFLRYCYCLFWWLCSVFVALSICRRPWQQALIFLFLLLFSPLDYMTISYTSVGLSCALVITCILYKLPTRTLFYGKGTVFAFALLWAMLILCCPFMLAAYVCLFLVTLVCYRIEQKKATRVYFRNLLFLFRYALIIDVILAIAYVFFFILSRTSLSAVIESIPHILSDPEHPSKGIVESVKNLGVLVFQDDPLYITVSLLSFIYSLIMRPYKSRLPLFAINAALFASAQVDTITTAYRFNVQMLHIIFLGAVAFSLLKTKNKKLFICSYGMCIVYSLLNGLASNTGIMAVSMTATVAGCAAILFLCQLSIEFVEQYRKCIPLRFIAAALVCFVLCWQISSELHIKMTRQYYDNAPLQLTETISRGAAKGLKTTPKIAQQYSADYDALQHLLSLVDTKGKQFLSCTSAPYLYLDADLDYATFSAWSFGYADTLNDRILAYQNINPGDIPDLIFCVNDSDKLPLIDDSYTQYTYNGYSLFVKQ